MSYDEIDGMDAVATDEFQGTTKYKQLVGVGIEARKKGDVSNWELGDAAQKVVQQHTDYLNKRYPGKQDAVNAAYGEGILSQYAEDIGVGYKVLDEYRRISRKYENPLRRGFSNLSWSHFRTAAGRDNPKEWLQKAQDNRWANTAFEDAIAESLGEKTSRQKTLERALDLTGMSPLEGLREILRLVLGHRVDIGAERVVEEIIDVKHTLPKLIERDLAQIVAGVQYLTEIYSAVKEESNA